MEQILKNERYSILGQQDGWIQISDGYISSDYVDIRYALNEARKLDLRTMAVSYTHLPADRRVNQRQQRRRLAQKHRQLQEKLIKSVLSS